MLHSLTVAVTYTFYRATEIRRRRQTARNASIAAKVSALKEASEAADKWQETKRSFLGPLAVGVLAVSIVGGVWLYRVWGWGAGGDLT